MTTEELIKTLRNHMALGPLALEIMMEAAARLESIQWELSQAIAERTPHDYGILRDQRDDYRARLSAEIAKTNTTRPEPSRLEIAAMLLAALAGRESESWEAKLEVIWAIEQADTLIAAANEAK